MFIIAACVLGALYMLRNAYGFGHRYVYYTFAFVCVILVIFALSLTKWRDVIIEDVAMDYPPEGLNPIDIGCIVDGKVNNRDVIAGFYYLAQRGYMTIREYELKHFEFVARAYPDGEAANIRLLYRAIFGGDICSLIRSQNGEVVDVESLDEYELTVRLVDIKDRLISEIPKVESVTLKSISKKRNRDIAVLTGMARGFRKSLIENKGEKAKSLIAENSDYIFTVIPYAYEFSITAKLASNFNIDVLDTPDWYIPYGVEEGYKFDVLVYNSMLRNLPEELRLQVFNEIGIIQKIGM